MTSIDKMQEHFWKFLRGDTPVKSFEDWLYSSDEIKDLLEPDFYLEMISVNYHDSEEVYSFKDSLTNYLRSQFKLNCECITLKDLAITDLGHEQETQIFKTFTEIKRHEKPLWWLSLHRCDHCKQSWLIAQETRQNDIHILQRIDSKLVQAITDQNQWPETFQTYEELLTIGRDNNRSVRFMEPIDDSPLIETASDLIKTRPSISIAEIASLLNLEIEMSKKIYKRALRK